MLSRTTQPADRWLLCGLAVVLSQHSAEGWLTTVWYPAGLLWRVLLLGVAGLWLIEWRYHPSAPGPALPAAIAILTTAVAVALDELAAVGADAMPAGLSPSVPALAASLHWAGGALGACLWQIGWATGKMVLRSRERRVPATAQWFMATGVWIWLLFPAGQGPPGDGFLQLAAAMVMAGLLPPVERLVFRRGGSPLPGAALRFAWWGAFVV